MENIIRRAAYADPPYMDIDKKFYERNAVNHPLLIAYLESFDGWALSCSSTTLQQVLAICPDDVRVGAWVKPFCSWKPNVDPAYAWEPVVFKPARVNKERQNPATTRDYIDANITLRRGFVGAKPARFCFWLFDLLGINPSDEFVDIFPGSGSVTRAHQGWQEESENQRVLAWT